MAANWRPDTPVRSVADIMCLSCRAHYIADWPCPGDMGVVAEASGPIGAAWWRFFDADDPGYVHGVMVARAQSGQGIGAALLRWAEEQARAAGAPALRLDCVESNHRLRAHYLAQGFDEVGRRDFPGPWHSVVLFEKCFVI